MAGSIINRLRTVIQNFESILGIGRRGYPDAFCLAGVEVNRAPIDAPKFSLKDIIGDGLLWAVPKHRRSLEKRLKRKFGHPDYHLKILLPRTNIRTCNKCGDDHEIGVLCPTCYKKIIDETREMQDAIQNELKLEPVEKEVVVLYSGEKEEKPDEFWEGKRIVEIPKERPSWFSKNLLQQTTQKPASTKEVKPSDLG
ncbi:39S ribosomal protein L32, mitochondrial [Aethina tumida]|uniref:39S ribosomal protein L32, mitochondrial n=1 Tax=Aethina tumida TaxID=116153 RepID=UPI00096AF32E|nr:39S ribosomal protein L32, mitochondrial [Aethina tumida]